MKVKDKDIEIIAVALHYAIEFIESYGLEDKDFERICELEDEFKSKVRK